MPIWQPCLLGLKGRGLRHAEGPRVSTETLPPPSGEEGTLPLTPGPPPPTPADPAPGPDPRLRAPPPGPASGLQPSEPSNPRGRLRPRAHSSEVGADPSGPRPHAWELAGPGPMRGSIRPGPRADLDPPGLPRAAPRPRPVPRGVPRRGGAPQPASMRLVAPPDGADRGRGAGRPDGPGPEGRAERGMPGSVVPRAFGPPLQRACPEPVDYSSQGAAREQPRTSLPRRPRARKPRPSPSRLQRRDSRTQAASKNPGSSLRPATRLGRRCEALQSSLAASPGQQKGVDVHMACCDTEPSIPPEGVSDSATRGAESSGRGLHPCEHLGHPSAWRLGSGEARAGAVGRLEGRGAQGGGGAPG